MKNFGYKNVSILLLGLLVLTPGCCERKKARSKKVEAVSDQAHSRRKTRNNKNINKEIDIAIPGDQLTIKSYFDDGIEEFSFDEDSNIATAIDLANAQAAAIGDTQSVDDYSWTVLPEATDIQSDFQPVYFEFDRYSITQQERGKAIADAQIAKSKLAAADQIGKELSVVITGNSDSAAGSDVYNLALSEKRAAELAKTFREQGVPSENIKIVGRGSEAPVMVNGKPLRGNKDEQWLNRRDEVAVVAA